MAKHPEQQSVNYLNETDFDTQTLRYLNQILDEINEVTKTNKPHEFDLDLLSQVLKDATQRHDNPLLVFKAMSVASEFVSRMTRLLVEYNMLPTFYALIPDPTLLDSAIKTGFINYEEPGSDDSLSMADVAAAAIEVGGIIHTANRFDGGRINNNPNISVNHQLMLLDNMCNSLPAMSQYNGPHHPHIIREIVNNILCKDPIRAVDKIRQREQAICTLSACESGYDLLSDAVEQTKKIAILQAVAQQLPDWYDRMMASTPIQQTLFTLLCEGESLESLPHSNKLGAHFCIKATADGIENGRLTMQGMRWLEGIWQANADPSVTLADAAFHTDKQIQKLVKDYQGYVDLLDTEAGVDVHTAHRAYPAIDSTLEITIEGEPSLMRISNNPVLLEQLYIEPGLRVFDTASRRKIHLHRSLDSQHMGRIEWAMAVCGDEFADKAVVTKLGAMVSPENSSGISWPTQAIAQKALVKMAQTPSLRPWLCDLSFHQYQNAFSETNTSLTRILRTINWKDDQIKRSMLEQGYDL